MLFSCTLCNRLFANKRLIEARHVEVAQRSVKAKSFKSN